MKVGDTVKVSFNDIKGDRRTLVRKEDGLYEKNNSNAYYAYYPTGKKAGVPIYEDSDDRVEKPVYEGKLLIREDAVEGEGTLGRESAFKPSGVKKSDQYFNAVYFDSKGYVTKLYLIGD